MDSIPQDMHNQIVEAMCRPVGSIVFDYTNKDLFNKNNIGGIIIDIPSKGQYFRLDRDKNFCLNFYHSSPGTGTRLATIDLNNIKSSNTVFLCLTWSPENISLSIEPRIKDGQLAHVDGGPSPREFSIGKDGQVYQIGDKGMNVMGFEFYEGGKKINGSSAIQTWRENIQAISILETGHSEEKYIYEVVVTNLILSILVTGFEVYTKKRFLEIENEGISPKIDLLFNEFLTKGEQEKNLTETIKEEAKQENISSLEYFVNKDKINFQNFKQCKTAFSKAYGLKFGEIGIEQRTLEKIQQYIKYRHKIIHVSPLTAIYNIDITPKEEPIFAKKELSDKATIDFTTFIEQLHTATLCLRPE